MTLTRNLLITNPTIDKKVIKCVVWDLDNTLWNGVLLEGDRVTLKNQVTEIIQTLDNRGILQCIASKNDYEKAISQLQDFGLHEYFIYPQINWNSKASSIKEIAKLLNIGIDAIAFIDDQPFELEEVNFSLPEVLCINAVELEHLLERDELNPRFITEDSKKRRLMYFSDLERQNAEKEFVGPQEEFLATLNMTFTISSAKEEDLQRAEELTVRTNQLNTTGYTYSYDELNHFRQSENHKLLIASLEDKFGSYGKIGLALVECQDSVWTIKLLLMSCRVMSRGVGTIMLNYILSLAKQNNVRLRAEFVSNNRNRMMYVSYKFAGFKQIQKQGELEILENDMTRIQLVPHYVKIQILGYGLMDRTKDEILERRAKLSPAKRALLEKLSRGEVEADAKLKTIPRRAEQSPAPLSFAQQRIWFLHQFDSGNAYNELSSVHLKGLLNVEALEKSLNEIVRRHEALRTTFEMVDGQAVQVVHPSWDFRLSILDFSTVQNPLPPYQGGDKIQDFVIEEAQKFFDLTKVPLLRGTLLKLGEQEYVLVFVMHHIICDGWSMRSLIREVAALYDAFSKSKPSPLPELPLQYADFAVWQRQWSKEYLQNHLSYWKQQLTAATTVLEIPTDKPRPAVQTFQGATTHFQLSPSLTQKLKSLSQQSGCTLFMTLLAAFQTLLYRYSGQEDISVGTPIANRNYSEIQPLIGVFVNTLVMRTDLSGNPSFRELLSRVRQVALGAYAHEDLPFEQLVEDLQAQRNLSHQPLFQVMFVLQENLTPELVLPGLTLKRLQVDSGASKFDLTLYLVDSEPAITGALEYSTDLFEAATIDRVIVHFTTLLEGIVTNPDRRLSELPLLTESERQTLLIEWNDIDSDFPQDTCIHELFEAQVKLTPCDVAVVFEDRQLTYQELNQQANQLAHYLRREGVQPDILVGICMERSLLMVIAILGILKAGGAYVPLDPAYPQSRLAFMLEDSQLEILLTQERLLAGLPGMTAKIVCLDRDWANIAKESANNPIKTATAENIAYTIYTSGSTGMPKGAMNTHRGVCNRLVWMQNTYQLNSTDRVLQKTPFSFDVSVWEFFWPLLTGARLVVAKPEGHKDSAYLVNLIAQQQITTLHFVPSMLRAFLEESELENCNCLRQVICSGEALPFELQERFFDRLNAKLHNLYGPTEAAIDVTAWTCQRESKRALVPIGRPIANTQIYLLDAHLQPVPIGVPGELYIGGVGLARGYHRRPELTAERFISNPFFNSSELNSKLKIQNSKLYKTGDLARYLPDGNIEFLGRLDDQVKIRGFRIELGEISAVLSQHPQVRTCLVLARSDEPGQKRLVAYLVPQGEAAPTISNLRCFLKQKLPEYMLPSAFVMLEALPLLPNGKIDRRALPAPDATRSDLLETYSAPSTIVEELLTGIWSKVLGIERVGIHDNFFELGGDSILSIQAIAKAKQAGLQLTPKQMFEYQTIAELATVAGWTATIQAEQEPLVGQVPLSAIQHWFFEQNLQQPHHWNLAILVRNAIAIAPDLLEKALQHLLVQHDALRLRFVQEESGWQQYAGSLDNPTVSLIRQNFSALSPQEQESAIQATIEQLQPSLNLSDGPLMRVAYFDLGAGKPSRLLFVIHHLIVDGLSWQILLEDLQTAYQQLSRGEPIQLPRKTTSLKQWSKRLIEYAQSAALQQELAYWNSLLQKPVSRLPVDYPGGENTVGSARTVSVALSGEETQALLQEVPQVLRMQMNEVLVAALVQAFAQWTGENSLLIDLEGDGRENIFNDIDLSRTLGWFTTIFPMRLELSNRNKGDVLRSIKEQLRQISHQGIGYSVLRYLSENREITAQLQAVPQAEVIFNYLGQLDRFFPEELMFKLADWNLEPRRSSQGINRHLLEGNGFVTGGQLWLNWTYSENLYQRSTVERLAQSCLEALREIIAHCQSSEAGDYTPSDFTDVELSPEQLEKALAEIDI
jgi:amino acid adenylation domain-containing protein/FkbH-like protein/non-ribosomal peptide synthase protein (TIGR01720 family)